MRNKPSLSQIVYLLLAVACLLVTLTQAEQNLPKLVESDESTPPIVSLERGEIIIDWEQTEDSVPSAFYSFGLDFWKEMLIGAGMVMSINWAKFWFPNECVKVCMHMVDDLATMVLNFWILGFNKYGWVIKDDTDYDTYTMPRSAYYIGVSNVSLLFSFPKAYNACQFTKTNPSYRLI